MKSKTAVKATGWGYLFVVLAALLWGLSGTAAKFLFNSGITPFQLVQMRLTISTVLLFFWFMIRRVSLLKIDRQDILYFIVFGTVGMAGVQFTYLFAISKIKVAAAILLQYLAPVFIALHALVFMGEKPNRFTLTALAGAILGCYLVVGAYNMDLLTMNLAGIISGILSAVAFAWYAIHGEYGMRRYNPWTVLFYALFFGAVVWNILHPPLDAFRQTYSGAQWGWIFYIGLMGTLIPFGLYLEGINLIRATRASITATLEPITAAVIAYIFLNERLEPLQVMGGVIVIAAVILLQFNREQDQKAPGVIRAGRRQD